jgi:hypothetical protein
MFGKSEITELLEKEIAHGLRDLARHDVNSEEYLKILDRLVSLHRIKEEDKSKFGSRDTLAVVFGNLLGIIMVVKHEHVNVITSRAFQLLLRPITRT